MNNQLFNSALKKFNEKNFIESKKLFEQLLSIEPKNFKAMHALGVVNGILKNHQAALSLFRQSLSLNKDFEPSIYNLATSLFETGQYEESIELFNKLLKKKQDDPNILLNYANCLVKLGRFDEAVNHYQSSLNINPNQFTPILNIGVVLHRKKNFNEALEYFLKAEKLNDKSAIVKYHLGNLFYDFKNFQKAINYLSKAINLNQDFTININSYEKIGLSLYELKEFNESKKIFAKMSSMEMEVSLKERVLINLSNCVCAINDNNFDLDYSEALDYANQALEINPSNIVALNNIGIAKLAMSNFDESIDSFHKALAVKPNERATLKNLVYAYNHSGQYEKTLETLEKIDSLYPEVVSTDMVRALTLFSLGRFQEGWKYYEHRWEPGHGSNKEKILPKFAKPIWKPELGNNSILIWAEQGLGDQILHGTMLFDFCQRFKKVSLAIDPRLVRFFQEAFPEIKVFSLFDEIEQDFFDYQIQLTSIGQYCRNKYDDFLPLKTPYKFLGNASNKENKKLRCAISWKSKNGSKSDYKSTTLESMKKILSIKEIEFFNIQYTNEDQEIEDFYKNYKIEIKNPPGIDTHKDIYGLINFIDSCDFVITISNTNAHLSGAIGKPTYLLLNDAIGKFWYWDNIYQEKNVWYPSVQRFIQKHHRVWYEPIEELYSFLSEKYKLNLN